MSSLIRWSLLASFALGIGLFCAQPALAQSRQKFVDDEAKMFSPEAETKANADIRDIVQRTKHELVIQTVENRPDAYKDKHAEWAQANFAKLNVNGVYVLICKEPTVLEVVAGRETERTGAFTAADRSGLRDVLLRELKAAKEKGKGNYDNALAAGVAFAKAHMRPSAAAVPPAGKRQAQPGQVVRQTEGAGSGILGWVCIGLAVLLGVWLIFAVIRAFSGGGAGSPGMAGGGMGGGGGGGFFSSLLGGMFGAAAGMWMYNNFFGGGMHSAYGGPSSAGYGGTDAGGVDQPDTAPGEASGGDWGGGDAGGGDVGGGDWGGGGGGDVGGGDWGGGGGDFGGGGGGGGDW